MYQELSSLIHFYFLEENEHGEGEKEREKE